VTYALTDVQGSVQGLSNATGSSLTTIRYGLFGEPPATAPSDPCADSSLRIGYAGEQRDAGSGLIYLRARYYDPGTGRFLSRDPFRGRRADPATQHGYSYAANNPVRWRDPSGRDLCDCYAGGGGGAGLVVAGSIVGLVYTVRETIDRVRERLDNLKEHTTNRDLDAARRERQGEVVRRRSDGTPFDHVQEVQNAQNGLLNRIKDVNKALSQPNLTQEEIDELLALLSELSHLLDLTEGFVPR
jgi:RHS repeat-associated protein